MAERLCVGAGERWTRPRSRVFELLVKAAAPVKAYDLIASYDAADPGATKPPTVYRALEFLETVGLAHRIASLNAYVACCAGKTGHAASFLICDCCGSAAEVEPNAADLARGMAQARGFRVEAVSIEVRGLCADCSINAGVSQAA